MNNCAAALMLTLAALAKRKEVLVSRGELIEIGGEFRIPDIMGASGAKLVEVGTTNRTRIGDYRTAASERTGAILKVHPSNYRVVGFTAEASAKDLATLADKRGVPFLYDVGSGLLAHGHGMPPDEPSVADALADGAGLVLCSGDKLLGGPQAGVVVGRAELIQKLRRHPVARAVRIDAMQVAALETVLSMYATGRDDDIPVHRMLRESADVGASPGAGAVRGDRRRPRARARPPMPVGGGRRIDAGREPRLLRGPRGRCPTRPASPHGSASARRRSSAAWRTAPCCWTCARSRPPRNPTWPARSCTRSRATTSTRTERWPSSVSSPPPGTSTTASRR